MVMLDYVYNKMFNKIKKGKFMTSQFSPKVSELLAFSREEAARLASRSVGPEHLLLAILREKEDPIYSLLVEFGINSK